MPKRAKVCECNVTMVYDMDNLVAAHRHARKDKASYREVKEVDKATEEYLVQLQKMEQSGEFHTSPYRYFQKREGRKVRNIAKLPYFPDRIHQWAIIQVVEPFLHRNLVSCTYSALPNRGTFAAYRDVRAALLSDVRGTQWCMKLDIRKYYESIDRTLLKQVYARLLKDKPLLDMIYEIVDSGEGEVGVPIGNYMSQYSGNVYLSKFDHYVKEVLRVAHYFRYMDDMLFFARTKAELQSLRTKVFCYLEEVLHLKVKDNWAIFYVDGQGVDFVGYVFTHKKIRLRRGIVRTIRSLSAKAWSRIKRGMLLNYRLFCGISGSVTGWLRRCDGGGLYLRYIVPLLPYLDEYYDSALCTSLRKKRGECKWSKYEGQFTTRRRTMLFFT